MHKLDDQKAVRQVSRDHLQVLGEGARGWFGPGCRRPRDADHLSAAGIEYIGDWGSTTNR